MTRLEQLLKENSIAEAFHPLIPDLSAVHEEPANIPASYLHARYESAMDMRTAHPLPTKEELMRFGENCKIIKAVTRGIGMRNYVLWEIFSAEQFRKTDQNFESFGTRLTGLSATHLRKCVHDGRIRIAMIQANLDDVRPTGRQVEELSRVEPAHTVKAWLHALEYMRNHGKSISIAIEALLGYCKTAEIRFGNRLPNGSGKIDMPKIVRRRKATKVDAPSPNGSDPADDWSLSPKEEQIFLELIPSPLETGEAANRREHVSRCIGALRQVASLHPTNEYTSSQMQALLALVARKENETARVLISVIYEKLRELIIQEIPNGTDQAEPAPEPAPNAKPPENETIS